jgi:hypothetical protein
MDAIGRLGYDSAAEYADMIGHVDPKNVYNAYKSVESVLTQSYKDGAMQEQPGMSFDEAV